MRPTKYAQVTRKIFKDLPPDFDDLFVQAMTIAQRVDAMDELTPTWLQGVRLWRETIDQAGARVAAQPKEDAWRRLQSV